MLAKFIVVIVALLEFGYSGGNADLSADTIDVSKRSRNPYSWMNEEKRMDNLNAWTNVNENMLGLDLDALEKRAKNPYSWMNSKEKRALRNPYSWMAFGEKRAPLNPYSWMYTLQKRAPFGYFRNPYSWLKSPAIW